MWVKKKASCSTAAIVRQAMAISCSPPSLPMSIRKRRISQEEIFGPVLAVIKARDFDHALEIANNTEFGLTGGVYSRNKEKLAKAQEVFHVGNLYLNRKVAPAQWSVPTPSADSICPGPTPKPAAKIICCCSCKPKRSPRNCRGRASARLASAKARALLDFAAQFRDRSCSLSVIAFSNRNIG